MLLSQENSREFSWVYLLVEGLSEVSVCHSGFLQLISVPSFHLHYFGSYHSNIVEVA